MANMSNKIAELGNVKLYSLQVLLLGVQNCLKDLSVNAKGKYVDQNLIGLGFWGFYRVRGQVLRL